MKANTKMKKLIKQLDLLKEEMREEFEEMIDVRRDEFNEKSEKWQESDRGNEFENGTDELEGWKDEIDNHFDWIFGELEKFENNPI